MFLTTVWQFVVNHWFIAGLIGIVCYTLFFALVEKIGFHVWYLLVIAVAAITAASMGLPLYFWPFLLGMITAFAEIISKFDDEPMKALKTFPALSYHVLNGVIAVFALYLLSLIAGKSADFTSVPAIDQLKYAMTAGFGAMLIMRSKLFNIKVGDDNVSFGPEQIINIVFRFMESAIGRTRACERRLFIEQKLKDIDFTKVYDHSVMTLKRALRLTTDDKYLMDLQEVKENLDALAQSAGNPDIQLRSYELGYIVYDRMGEVFVSELFSNPPSEWLLRAPAPEVSKGTLPTLFEVNPDNALRALPFIGTKAEVEAYMAYGTNMASNCIRERLDWMESSDREKLEKTSRKLCVLKGYRLAFNGVSDSDPIEHGLANLMTEPGAEVPGVLYELPRKAIDYLEKHERGYHRATVKVVVKGETKETEAIVFLADQVGPETVPNQRYLSSMIQGAGEHGLDLAYINKWQTLITRRASENLPDTGGVSDKNGGTGNGAGQGTQAKDANVADNQPSKT